MSLRVAAWGGDKGYPRCLESSLVGRLRGRTEVSVMSAESSYDDLETLAADVAMILSHQLEPKEILRLQQLVFLEVDEVALLLRVKRKTVQEWVSDDKIPFRFSLESTVRRGSGVFWCLPASNVASNFLDSFTAHCEYEFEAAVCEPARAVTKRRRL